MKRSEVKDFIPLLQAWADGKTIQYRPNCREGDWQDLPGYEDDFDTNRYEYRIKPEPREFYVLVDGIGIPIGVSLGSHSGAVIPVPKGVDARFTKIIKVREVTE